ncbi:MAG: fused protease/ribonucleoside-triphosphate reductase [Gammaproteobacteria bacterium]|nr:fused protease/ribonucleoside-triphosphate reductase [Gammaproteobacteria bacterium]NIR85303.1 fused protease/ribonucleoside-triphosphate reductase [Gammaproteobacteria bacterium]NIR88419.1 fused protease/ribonucleoside-triphosphate reductase [Gammaproteobacteria bacterium]NIU06369.1 fused protease/ribonucleoside-triphosphate reductase [Gammaproteobacteria bacterium]NIV53268.1 fused protease/ribonucleoside-triphosphate reductase [Gammaproteobacteria bacterium]
MMVDVDSFGPFELDPEFLAPYQAAAVKWGYGALSWTTYKRTYSRDGEEWWETCRRVIEGMMTVQRIHCLERRLPWDGGKAQHIARNAYERLWSFKWTPPGRGLWIMGTRFMYERGGAALNNCGFVSTRDIERDYASPYGWMLRMSMLGVGVGFDTRGKGRVTIQEPARGGDAHAIDDSREGWAEALERLLRAYAGTGTLPARWDYSRIRPKGTPLKRFGGVASGPEPLRDMLDTVDRLHRRYVHRRIDTELIVDTMNVVGRCVVAGGIRRSAQIAFGDPDDTRFLDLKLDREKLHAHRWASNNSVLAQVGMDYADIARRTALNGEPGYLWLENARAYGRMQDPPNWLDRHAEGSNPCMEQTLWDRELCTLVETYPAHHDDFEDYRKTLRIAYLYAKTVTLVPTHDAQTNAIMLRNRRIGCSMTGIVQAMNRLGYRRFFEWCDSAYRFIQQLDKEYADWLCVPRSIKTTSVKPSGTVSLLSGATPGAHWEHAPYYVRRVRVSDGHPLAELCAKAGYPVEPDKYVDNTAIISFPVNVPHLERCKAQVSLREKVDLAAQMQHYWSDNQVSCTAEFDPETERDELPRVLAAYEDRLKGIVFLPSSGHGYEQPPYETITREQYEEMCSRLKPLSGDLEHEQELEAAFCEGGTCELP